MDASEYNRMKFAFDEDLDDVGANLLQAYKRKLLRDDVLAAIDATERKLTEYSACLEKCDEFFRQKFEEAEQESIAQLQVRLAAIKADPIK